MPELVAIKTAVGLCGDVALKCQDREVRTASRPGYEVGKVSDLLGEELCREAVGHGRRVPQRFLSFVKRRYDFHGPWCLAVAVNEDVRCGQHLARSDEKARAAKVVLTRAGLDIESAYPTE